MSKEQKVIWVDASELVWLPEHNFGKASSLFDSEAKSAEKAVQLLEGWSIDYVVKVVKLDDATKTRAVDYLKGRWEALQKLDHNIKFLTEPKTELSPAQLREGFRNLYGGEKIKTPTYEGVFAFQRGLALPFVTALQLALKRDPEFKIPVVVMKYENNADRVRDCSDENNRKMAGFDARVLRNWQSRYKACYESFEASGKTLGESGIRRILSGGAPGKEVGNAQTVYAVIALSSRFPKLGIKEQIMDMTVVDVNGKTDTKGETFARTLASNRDRLRELEMGTRDDVKEEDAEDVEAVEEFVADPNTSKSGASKMIPRKTLKNILKTYANIKTKYIVKAILDGNVDALMKLEAMASDDNESMEKAGLFIRPSTVVAEEPVRESVAAGGTAH